MKKYNITLLLLVLMLSIAAFAQQGGKKKLSKSETPFVWEGANLYFLLTDRFNNGDTTNDVTLNRTEPTGVLRGFEGGDIRGIIQKIDEGYFRELGINAIWFTPVVEQIHGATDEGTGNSYGFHGYWARDWTKLDPNFGTEKDLAELVDKAHKNGIRIVLDGVINHTGPVTKEDTVWPQEWVRTSPECTYNSYLNTISCTLVKNLPDIRTDSNAEVALPQFLVEKWKKEGRYDQEVKELDAFFARTGYPRAPRYYIIKWLTDYISDYGVDGYRADTVKHTEEYVWSDFSKQCDYAFALWKKNNPVKVLDDNPFFTVGEVYNYNISSEKLYDFGDKKVDYYANGFTALINFELKYDAVQDYETIFAKYSNILNKGLKGNTVMNYMTSHDDGAPFDKSRTKNEEAANKLLLTPGISQVYYGDETARSLEIKDAVGDATLRSFMNWDDIKNNPKTAATLLHWQKLGQFRANHPAVGAGIHALISKAPYVFSRTYSKAQFQDAVVIGLELAKGKKEIPTGTIFKNGTVVRDAYSGKTATVKNGKVTLDTDFTILLLEVKKK
ncbi:alpha-amylase family glycosyl hydrolase [Flavobacterium kingsejongi]|uniref:Alpha-amlyase n=1 Tax=Flavobacterium kingsejongi TaxID=1678728 RepID=A0A2S1LN16_9FLAO|nr:alpha-amylase family glycosyl hydrolase [Flavobacterium kingsejongi]AWG25078.1 alpha-amlyase [Flavobacterium kingsejongi]